MQSVAENEWIMYKARFGAFYRTPLEEHLRGLNVTTLVFVGCNSRTVLARASMRPLSEIPGRVVEDAVSGI